MSTTPDHTPENPENPENPGAAAQPAQPSQPAVPPPPSSAPATQPGMLMKIVRALAVPLILMIGFFIWKGAGVGAPKPGECVNITATGEKVESVDTVKCDDPNAGYKVTGVVKNVSESDFTKDTEGTTCKDFAGTTSWLWQGGSNGFVLCLIENTK